jgi:hypothetical protein
MGANGGHDVARIPRTTNPPPRNYGIRWWLLQAPGYALIWLATCMYPGRGKVLASGRRFRVPFIEFVYTMMIYAVLGSIALFACFVYKEIALERAVYRAHTLYRPPR